MGDVGTNWAGNYTYQATRLYEPTTMDELRAIVAHAPQIHGLGTRHCFNAVADAAALISLQQMPPAIEIDQDARTVTFNAGLRYGDLAPKLELAGLALPNLASLPHISVIGAVATATHGSGDACGNLATPVSALELVTSEGDVLQLRRGDDDFAGAVVGVGALGVVTRLTLDLVPSFLVQQQVFEHLEWDALFAHFDEITSSAYSVSLFTDYGETINEVWLKSRVEPGDDVPHPPSFFGAPAATHNLHPVPRLESANCTEQLGVPGPWLQRLTHFRLDAVPASGDEIQSEYMVAREQAVPALQALRALGDELRPHLWTTEVRTVAADDLWLSTAYKRPSVCIHFSWYKEPDDVARLVPMVEQALAPFSPRPHWGKVFSLGARDMDSRYERIGDFRRLQARLDPRGAFRTDFLAHHVLG